MAKLSVPAIVPVLRTLRRSSTGRVSLKAIVTFLLLTWMGVQLTACCRFCSVKRPAVDGLLFQEERQVSAVCLSLESQSSAWMSGQNLSLSKAGLTQLRRAYYDEALALADSVKDLAPACNPANLRDAFVDKAKQAAAAESTVIEGWSDVEECANALDKLDIPKDADSDAFKLLAAVRRASDQVGSLFDDPATFVRLIDASSGIVRLAVRGTQQIHEFVDNSFLSKLPFGSAVAKTLSEMIAGELAALTVEHLVYQLESKELASRADVARTACELLDKGDTRPVVTNRMLVRLVLRFVDFGNDGAKCVADVDCEMGSPNLEAPTHSVASICSESPGRCRALARKINLRRPFDERVPVGDADELYPDFRAVGMGGPVPEGLETDSPAAPDARIERNSLALLRAASTCASVDVCTMAQINHVLSEIVLLWEAPELEKLPRIPPMPSPEECVNCCCPGCSTSAPPSAREIQPPDLKGTAVTVAGDRSVSMTRCLDTVDTSKKTKNRKRHARTLQGECWTGEKKGGKRVLVEGASRWTELQRAIREFRGQFPTGQEIWFPTGKTRCEVAGQGAAGEEEPRGNGTPLADALKKAAGTSKTVVLVSDLVGNCVDEKYDAKAAGLARARAAAKSVVSQARNDDTTVFVVGIDLKDKGFAKKLAELAGTVRVFDAGDGGEIGARLREVSDAIRCTADIPPGVGTVGEVTLGNTQLDELSLAECDGGNKDGWTPGSGTVRICGSACGRFRGEDGSPRERGFVTPGR